MFIYSGSVKKTPTVNGDEIRFLNLCAELMFSLGLWVTVTGELTLASRLSVNFTKMAHF